MSTTLTVGGVTAAPGQVASGWIDVPDGTDPGTRIPVTVANGAAPGPVLALIGGTHGAEYTSILALQRLRPDSSPPGCEAPRSSSTWRIRPPSTAVGSTTGRTART